MISLNDVLLAMSNIPVDDPIAEIWGRGLQGGYEIIEYTGTLPITINANGDALLDYRIYGADGGLGEPTENLFDIRKVSNPPRCVYSGSTFTLKDQGLNYDIMCKTNGANAPLLPEKMIAVSPGAYTLTFGNGTTGPDNARITVRFFDGETRAVLVNQARFLPPISFTFVVENNGYLSFLLNGGDITISDFMLVKRSTAPTSYIPYGYKLPMVTRSENLYNKNDPDIVYSAYMNYAGTIIQGSYGDAVKVSGYIPINGGQTYTGTNLRNSGAGNYYAYYDTNKQLLGTGLAANNMVFNSPTNAAYIRTTLVHRLSEDIAMLTEGSAAPSSYIPYAKTTTPVYIGENKLEENEYVSYGEQKIYRDVSGTLTPTDPPVPLPEIPTIDGTTIIDYDGTPKPSQMYIKYKGKAVQ